MQRLIEDAGYGAFNDCRLNWPQCMQIHERARYASSGPARWFILTDTSIIEYLICRFTVYVTLEDVRSLIDEAGYLTVDEMRRLGRDR